MNKRKIKVEGTDVLAERLKAHRHGHRRYKGPYISFGMLDCEKNSAEQARKLSVKQIKRG